MHLKFTVLHSPDFITARGPWRKVITIHDLYFLRNASVMNADGAGYYAKTAWSAQTADAIIAVSAFTRDDILRLLPNVEPGKVHVVHEAADIAPEPAKRAVTERKHALFIGTFEPRKNLQVLIEALALAPDVQLKIVGAAGWGNDNLHALADELGVLPRVSFEQRHMNDDERDALIRGARMLVMPSLYEGFGLPPLEAMARGVPVVCSNAGSLPEVAGDAALYHDPQDARVLAAHLNMLWHDDVAHERLAALGPPQAARFSWERAARETANVYVSALRGRRNKATT